MKKTLLLCLALVITLGTVGVGYALWSEDLYIQGAAHTGEVDAAWSVESCGQSCDRCGDRCCGHCRDHCHNHCGDHCCDHCGQCTDITCGISPDGHTLFVTITNAHPRDEFYVIFDIHCSGTVPIHVGEFIVNQNVSASQDSGDGIINNHQNCPCCPSPQCEPFSVDVEYYGPWQLHPSQSGYGRIDIKLNKCIEPCTTYTFSIEVEVGQYNEFPIGGTS